MSLMDKIKSMFSGGSSDSTGAHAGHDHSGHDHSGHDHSHEPDASTMPTSDTASSEQGDDKLN